MANCEYCKADCAHIGEHQVKACKGYIPQTNADRIRAMSDEELAEWIGAHADCGACPADEYCANGRYCEASWRMWLRQDAMEKEETT